MKMRTGTVERLGQRIQTAGRILACVLAAGLFFAGLTAGAETWDVRDGTLTDAETGESSELSGFFEASLPDYPPLETDPDPLTVLVVDDFEFQAGDDVLTPRLPIDYDGLKPIFFLEIADQIHVRNNGQVSLLLMRAGGEWVAESEDEVTYRYIELRSETADGGTATGGTPDNPLPIGFDLHGTVYEVDQTFTIQREGSCGLFPGLILPPQPPGGGVIGGGVVSGGSVSISAGLGWNSLQLDVSNELAPLEVGQVDVARLESVSVEGGSGAAAEPVTAPTPEELGITAPDGVEVIFDSEGVLEIRSAGDIDMVGPFPEVPGLTKLIIVAARITITGDFVFPEGVDVRIEATDLIIDPDVVIPQPGPDDPPVITPLCRGLRRAGAPVERQLGTFSMVAGSSQVVEIDVNPWQRNNRVPLGRRAPITVALIGSDELDVDDVDPNSLRLGPGQAEPVSYRGWSWVFPMDVNRDGAMDLVGVFLVRESGIEPGDEEVCLTAEANDGTLLEGCDAIETRPSWRRFFEERASRARRRR